MRSFATLVFVGDCGILLGAYPTPVQQVSIGGGSLWVKRDDLTSTIYGGNKVRKLEHFLAEARRRGCRTLLTLGAVGSHQVVATSLFGALNGFRVEAVLVGQPWSARADLNIRLSLASGLRAFPVSSWAHVPRALHQRQSHDTLTIPLGGSSVLGTLGYVSAAHELADQIARREVPSPDCVVVASGSGGTVAGLAVGFEERQIDVSLLGVAVSGPLPVVGAMTRLLAWRTARARGLSMRATRSALSRIRIVGDFVGRGYGHATPAGEAAENAASSCGLLVDSTYTAKALACALAEMRAGRSVVFWHTLSSAREAAAEFPLLPDELSRLLRR